jgi:hypothetical protein
MQISFIRNKEDIKSISALKKSLTQKNTRIRIYIIGIIGIVLFLYSGDDTYESSFSGYSMLSMAFLGAALMLYLETFYPKLNFNAKDAIKDYKEYDSKDFFYKIEINDDAIIYEIPGHYIKMDWNAFKRFKIYKNHIFLLKSGNNYEAGITIKYSELTQGEFTELYSFLKEKFPESNKK